MAMFNSELVLHHVTWDFSPFKYGGFTMKNCQGSEFHEFIMSRTSYNHYHRIHENHHFGFHQKNNIN